MCKPWQKVQYTFMSGHLWSPGMGGKEGEQRGWWVGYAANGTLENRIFDQTLVYQPPTGIPPVAYTHNPTFFSSLDPSLPLLSIHPPLIPFPSSSFPFYSTNKRGPLVHRFGFQYGSVVKLVRRSKRRSISTCTVSRESNVRIWNVSKRFVVGRIGEWKFSRYGYSSTSSMRSRNEEKVSVKK